MLFRDQVPVPLCHHPPLSPHPQPDTRGDWLYNLAMAKQLEQARRAASAAARRRRAEMAPCTFHPQTGTLPTSTQQQQLLRTLEDAEDAGADGGISLAVAAAGPGGPSAAGPAGPKGYSSYLRRMARATDEREEKRRLEAALAAGMLHRFRHGTQVPQQPHAADSSVNEPAGFPAAAPHPSQRQQQGSGGPGSNHPPVGSVAAAGASVGSMMSPGLVYWGPTGPRHPQQQQQQLPQHQPSYLLSSPAPPLPFASAATPSTNSLWSESSLPPFSAVTRRTPPPLAPGDEAEVEGHRQFNLTALSERQPPQEQQTTHQLEWYSPGLVAGPQSALPQSVPVAQLSHLPTPQRPQSLLPTATGPPDDYDTGAAADEPPLLYLDVHVTPSQVARVPIWAHSDVNVLAEAFAQRHGLASKVVDRLARLMLQKQSEALSAAPLS